MIFSDSLASDLLGILLSLFVVFISYFKWSYSYWKRKNLPFLEPKIPFGNVLNPFKRIEAIGVTAKRLYEEMKSKGWRHGGVYVLTRPVYFAIHLEYVKNILTKHFQYFGDRGIYYNEKDDPISANLVAISGIKWRNLRIKLNPTFTSAKMKMMFQTLIKCETGLQEKMDVESKKREPIDIKEVLGCFTTDIIGSCAFGLECNTFKSQNSPFRIYGKKVSTITVFRRLKSYFSLTFPELARLLKMRQIPADTSAFFTKIVTDTVNYREKNNYTRADFMQLLIDLKHNKLAEQDCHQLDGKTLTIEEITAQSFIFFVAGFETSSTAMAFALYELAKNQDIQEKVRHEINSVLATHDGKVTYDSIQDLEYMNQVINETLRKYPPIPFVLRQCVQDYKIPDEDIVIKKGTEVMIPILGIHYDEEYYPDPEKFDPERFNNVNTNARHQYAHLPFGEGPRICIGMRFGLMQTKVGLTSLLRKYKFTLNERTKQPLKFQVNSFILVADGEIWLDAQKL